MMERDEIDFEPSLIAGLDRVLAPLKRILSPASAQRVRRRKSTMRSMAGRVGAMNSICT